MKLVTIFFVFGAVVTTGMARRAREEVENIDEVRQYKTSYGVNSPETGDQKSSSEERIGDRIRGSYSLVQPDGVVRTVIYTSGPNTGFEARVVNRRRKGKKKPTLLREKLRAIIPESSLPPAGPLRPLSVAPSFGIPSNQQLSSIPESAPQAPPRLRRPLSITPAFKSYIVPASPQPPHVVAPRARKPVSAAPAPFVTRAGPSRVAPPPSNPNYLVTQQLSLATPPPSPLQVSKPISVPQPLPTPPLNVAPLPKLSLPQSPSSPYNIGNLGTLGLTGGGSIATTNVPGLGGVQILNVGGLGLAFG